MLLIGVALRLSGAEMAPLGESFAQGEYVAPSAAIHGSSVDPHFCLEDPQPGIE